MFISKWRLAQNLENARQEGIKEGIRVGKREANEQKLAYMEYLEQENKALQDSLVEARQELTGCKVGAIDVAAKIAEDAKAQMNKGVVEAFAQELACWQKMADVAYYEKGNQEENSCLLDKAFALKELANKMGICGDVYERAYQIYDFRNSGKEGYTLKDGKIVKVEQEKTALVCPFMEEQGQQNNGENSTGDETAVCCPEMSGLPDRCENCHVVQGFCDEESFF